MTCCIVLIGLEVACVEISCTPDHSNRWYTSRFIGHTLPARNLSQLCENFLPLLVLLHLRWPAPGLLRARVGGKVGQDEGGVGAGVPPGCMQMQCPGRRALAVLRSAWPAAAVASARSAKAPSRPQGNRRAPAGSPSSLRGFRLRPTDPYLAPARSPRLF